MDVDRRVSRRYDVTDEDQRLWAPGKGDLLRLRTWDIFERFLPPSGRVLDVGGGPGTHAAHLAERGYDVTLVDPVPRHVEQAAARAAAGPSFSARIGAAHDLPATDGTIDAVLLMGPLYHLFTTADRVAALREARRVLRPGGRSLAEVIARPAWLLDAARKRLLADPGVWESVVHSVATGMSQDPGVDVEDGAFWAYFHEPGELRSELVAAGLAEVEVLAVEGFAWLLDDLEERMADPAPLLRAVRLAETEPSLLGCSAHVMGVATRDGG